MSTESDHNDRRNLMTALDRYRGCLSGLAAGDALGTTLEFEQPGEFSPITDMVGGGPFDLKPGQWTDDTSMALCLAESLITQKGFDPVHQLELYVRWHRQGHLSSTGTCFDIGGTTWEAAEQLRAEATAIPRPRRRLQSRERLAHASGARTAGVRERSGEGHRPFGRKLAHHARRGRVCGRVPVLRRAATCRGQRTVEGANPPQQLRTGDGVLPPHPADGQGRARSPAGRSR